MEGEFAYQSPVGHASLFGRALLEGLEGLPPDHVPYDRASVPWRLLFQGLEGHVQQRVAELLRDAARAVASAPSSRSASWSTASAPSRSGGASSE